MPPKGTQDDNIDDNLNAGDDVTLDSIPEEHREAVQKLIDKETNGLKAKRDELLTKLKAAKKGNTDLDEVSRLNARIAELEDEGKNKGKDKDEDKVRRIQEDATKKVTDAEARAKAAEERANKVVIDSALRKGTADVKVLDGLQDSVLALIRSKYSVEVNDDGEVEIDGKEVAEFMADWAKTDEGKAHVGARVDGGSGANGIYRLPGQAGVVKTKADLKTPGDKSKFIAEHGLEAWKSLPVGETAKKK